MINLTPASIGKTFFFEHYFASTGRKVMLTDILAGYFTDADGTIVYFDYIIPRDADTTAADVFHGFHVGKNDSLTLVEEDGA